MKNEKIPARDGRNNSADKLPPIGKEVRVSCDGRECSAYVDAQHKWRNYYNGDILGGNVSIVELEIHLGW